MTAHAVMSDKSRLDWLGVICSVGCAIHCAAMPIVFATLPSITSVKWLADPLFHQVVAVLCGVLVTRAILPGYREHRDRRVVAFSGLGMSLLFVAAFILPDTCCSDLESRTPVQVAQAETTLDAPQIKLISTKLSLVSKINHQHPHAAGDSAVGSESTLKLAANEHAACDHSHCEHTATLSSPLLSAVELESHLGASAAQKLLRVQPYLSPIGGLFLIIAHVMNLRLRTGKRAGCCDSHA